MKYNETETEDIMYLIKLLSTTLLLKQKEYQTHISVRNSELLRCLQAF